MVEQSYQEENDFIQPLGGILYRLGSEMNPTASFALRIREQCEVRQSTECFLKQSLCETTLKNCTEG